MWGYTVDFSDRNTVRDEFHLPIVTAFLNDCDETAMSPIQTSAHCTLLELDFHSNHSGGIRVNRNLGACP